MDALQELDEMLVNAGSPLICNRKVLQAVRDELAAARLSLKESGAVTRTMVRLNGSEFPVHVNVAGAIGHMRVALRHAGESIGLPADVSGSKPDDYIYLDGRKVTIAQARMIQDVLRRYDDRTVDA